MDKVDGLFLLHPKVGELFMEYSSCRLVIEFKSPNEKYCSCSTTYRDVRELKVVGNENDGTCWGVGSIKVTCKKCGTQGETEWKNVQTIMAGAGKSGCAWEVVYSTDPTFLSEESE